jgi:hypothetical protein
MNRLQRRAYEKATRGRSKPIVARKVWPTNIDTIQYAIEGASISGRDKLDKLLMRELSAIDSFTRGNATMQEWQDLVAINNVALTLCGMGVGPEAVTDCQAAEHGLIEAAARFERTGRMGLSGPAIKALRSVIEWHEAQRSAIPRSQYEEAIRLTSARIKSGHATIDLAKTLGKAQSLPIHSEN